jgi:hypothetical protein
MKTAGNVTVQADNAGNYYIGATTLGDGFLDGAAGFFTWYYSPYADSNKRFSVLLQYDDKQQTDTGPSQNDTVGGFDSHGGHPGGTVALETHFDAQADSWYEGFIWSEAHVDSGWFIGFSASQINFQARVAFVVFATDTD